VLQGNNIILASCPTGTLTVRVWYLKGVDRLTLDQGRITVIGSSTLTLNSIGSDLTNSITDLKCFISIIDSHNGDVKGTYQVSSINTGTKTLTIKSSSLDRTVVYKKTVSSSLSSTIALDDYVCLALGTCVSQLPDMFQDYIIQYATSQIITSIGEDSTPYERELKLLEKRIENAWAGKEGSMRVKINKDRSRYPYFISNL
jgi:hypothetical protein